MSKLPSNCSNFVLCSSRLKAQRPWGFTGHVRHGVETCTTPFWYNPQELQEEKENFFYETQKCLTNKFEEKKYAP
jgi:hypothetical protein